MNLSGVEMSGFGRAGLHRDAIADARDVAGSARELGARVGVLHHLDRHDAEIERRAGMASLISSGVPRTDVELVAGGLLEARPSSFRLAVIEPPASTLSSAARAAGASAMASANAALVGGELIHGGPQFCGLRQRSREVAGCGIVETVCAGGLSVGEVSPRRLAGDGCFTRDRRPALRSWLSASSPFRQRVGLPVDQRGLVAPVDQLRHHRAVGAASHEPGDPHWSRTACGSRTRGHRSCAHRRRGGASLPSACRGRNAAEHEQRHEVELAQAQAGDRGDRHRPRIGVAAGPRKLAISRPPDLCSLNWRCGCALLLQRRAAVASRVGFGGEKPTRLAFGPVRVVRLPSTTAHGPRRAARRT